MIKRSATRHHDLDSKYADKCESLLKEFQNQLRASKSVYLNNQYAFHYPSFGDQFFNYKIIILYGQCIAGKWEPQFNLNTSINNSIIRTAFEYSNTCNEGEISPLDWVNKNWSKYRMSKSFFWQVGYKLTNKLMGINDYINSEEWCRYMGWSNLMKIGNYEGGNPDNNEYNAQIAGCVQLFYQELNNIQPEIAVLLTGESWAENFIKRMDLKLDLGKDPFIISSGYYNDTKIIVTQRPFRGYSEPAVNQIMEAIQNCK